jgi:hypothetical protein
MDDSILPYFLCMDCKKDTNNSNEIYSLKQRIWLRANPLIARMLCLECVERRLGRNLVADDFSRAPINAENAAVCPALATRLAR